MKKSSNASTTREKVAAAVKQIEEGLESFRSSSEWKNFLKFQSVMHNYSINNKILIWLQRRDATHVAGFHAWKKLGRSVKKGAKGIAILAPYVINKKDAEPCVEGVDAEEREDRRIVLYRQVYVFDVSDTEGSDEFLPKARPFSNDDGEEAQHTYEALLQAIRGKVEHSFPVRLEKEAGAYGSFAPKEKLIRIDPEANGANAVHTLLHEWAHAQDFDMHPDKAGAKPLPYGLREFVAESASFIVGARLGFDGQTEREHSFDYILSYERHNGDFKKVAEQVQKVATRCIDELAATGMCEFAGIA